MEGVADNNKKNQQEGVVLEALPNATFRVKLNDGKEIFTHLAGRMRVHFIRILTGDRVLVDISPDGTRGRIVYRYK